MISFDIKDASRRLAEVGYVPAWLAHLDGGYLNATRPGSVNLHPFNNVVVKLHDGGRFSSPRIALAAKSLQDALVHVLPRLNGYPQGAFKSHRRRHRNQLLRPKRALIDYGNERLGNENAGDPKVSGV